MPTPPIKKTTQADYVQSKVRLPPTIYKDLSEAAKINGRSLNAEILARLTEGSIHERLESLDAKSNKIEQMLKQLLDK